jgi:hypothetical protein
MKLTKRRVRKRGFDIWLPGLSRGQEIAGICEARRTAACPGNPNANPNNQRLNQIMRDSGGVPSKPLRKAEPVAPFASSVGRDYAAAISRVALIGSFSTLHNALRFSSRGLT